jgi:hypothetical protein
MLIVDSSRTLDTVSHAPVQSNQTPLWEGDTDDWNLESTALHHRIERGKYLLVGQIARHTEDHQRP